MFTAGVGVPSRDNARRLVRFALVLSMAVTAMGARCATPPNDPPAKQTEISREHAIAIARKQVNFTPDSVDAVQGTSEGPGHPAVWRVTFKGRLPGQPPGLFETRIIEIDVRTGAIVSASMN
jgi:hypothetical protein